MNGAKRELKARSTVDLRLLKYFVTVAEELHFGRAARRLHMSQPPLSQAIQRLEGALGVALLVRSRRHVELTEAGHLLLKEARLLLAQDARFRGAALQIAEGRVGTLRIGYTLSVPFLPGFMRAVRSFRSESPQVVLELTRTQTSTGIEAVRQSKLDVVIVRHFLDVPPELESAVIAQDRFMLILPSNHPLAKYKSVKPKQLANEAFIEYARERQIGLHDHIRRTWLHDEMEPRLIQDASDTPTLMALVAAGLGVSILPSTLRIINIPDLAWREIDAPEREVLSTFLMLYRKGSDADPVLARFIDLLRREAPASAKSLGTAG